MQGDFESALRDFCKRSNAVTPHERGGGLELVPHPRGLSPYRSVVLMLFSSAVLLWLSQDLVRGSLLSDMMLHLMVWVWLALGAQTLFRALGTPQRKLRMVTDGEGGSGSLAVGNIETQPENTKLAASMDNGGLTTWLLPEDGPSIHLWTARGGIVDSVAELGTLLGCEFVGVIKPRASRLVTVLLVVGLGCLGVVAKHELGVSIFVVFVCVFVLALVAAMWTQRRYIQSATQTMRASEATAWEPWRDVGQEEGGAPLGDQQLNQPMLMLIEDKTSVRLSATPWAKATSRTAALGAAGASCFALLAIRSAIESGAQSSLWLGMWLLLVGLALLNRWRSLSVREVVVGKRAPLDESAYRTSDDQGGGVLVPPEVPLRFMINTPKFGSRGELWVEREGRVRRVGEVHTEGPEEASMAPIANVLRRLDPEARTRGLLGLLDVRFRWALHTALGGGFVFYLSGKANPDAGVNTFQALLASGGVLFFATVISFATSRGHKRLMKTVFKQWRINAPDPAEGTNPEAPR